MSNWLIENRREDWRREMSEQLANCKQRQEKLGSEHTRNSGHFDKKLQRFFD